MLRRWKKLQPPKNNILPLILIIKKKQRIISYTISSTLLQNWLFLLLYFLDGYRVYSYIRVRHLSVSSRLNSLLFVEWRRDAIRRLPWDSSDCLCLPVERESSSKNALTRVSILPHWTIGGEKMLRALGKMLCNSDEFRFWFSLRSCKICHVQDMSLRWTLFREVVTSWMKWASWSSNKANRYESTPILSKSKQIKRTWIHKLNWLQK